MLLGRPAEAALMTAQELAQQLSTGTTHLADRSLPLIDMDMFFLGQINVQTQTCNWQTRVEIFVWSNILQDVGFFMQ